MRTKSLIAAVLFVLSLPICYANISGRAATSQFEGAVYAQNIDCSHGQGSNCASPSPSNAMAHSDHRSHSGPTPSNNPGMPDFGTGSGLLALGLALVVWLRLR